MDYDPMLDEIRETPGNVVEHIFQEVAAVAGLIVILVVLTIVALTA